MSMVISVITEKELCYNYCHQSILSSFWRLQNYYFKYFREQKIYDPMSLPPTYSEDIFNERSIRTGLSISFVSDPDYSDAPE